MKTLKIISTILISLLFLGELKAQGEFVKGEIYLKLRDNQPVASNYSSHEVNIQRDVPFLETLIQQFQITQVRRSFWFSNNERLNRIFRVKISGDEKAILLIENLKKIKEVEYAERVPLNKISFTPDDLGSNTSGSKGQYALYKINAQEAWDNCQGKVNDIVIAVVDNAFDMNHPDLADQYTTGYDVADGDSDPSYPSTNFDHGTHCAGIVGASTNNNLGISSLGYNLRIMPVKATGDSDPDSIITAGYDGILMAAMMGASVISCSWGSNSYSSTDAFIVDFAQDLGCIIVAAAGNNNNPLNYYPASYPGVVGVASSDNNDVRAADSNFGSWISVSAPGVSIYSTLPNDTYGLKWGTSMAGPLVAALCGLIRTIDPAMSAADAKDLIESTSDNIDTENPSYAGLLGAGRINAGEALKQILPCVTTTSLLSDIDVAKVEATTSISASGAVNADQLTLDAGSYVDLKEGFLAANGHQLIVINDGCGGAKFSPGHDGDTESNEFPDEKTVTSIPDVREHPGFKVFPNPASSLAAIQCVIAVSGTLSIYLSDLSGKKIKTIVNQESVAAGTLEKQVDVSDLPNGLYHCVIISNSEIQTVKISVLH